MCPDPRSHGFILLDAMLGVAIFAVGVLALGAAVNNCLDGQLALREARRGRTLVENRMGEILAGSIPVRSEFIEALDGADTGVSLVQTAQPLDAEDEKGNKVTGINVVNIAAKWMSAGEPQVSDVTFYMLSNAPTARP